MPRPLRVAVQMDPIEGINIDTDSTFALMLEAQARGHLLWHYGVRNITLREGIRHQGVKSDCWRVPTHSEFSACTALTIRLAMRPGLTWVRWMWS